MTTHTDDRRRAAAGRTSGGVMSPARPWSRIGLPHRDTLGPPRAATQDVEVAGVRIRTDEAVHVSHTTANRAPGASPSDEARFSGALTRRAHTLPVTW